MKCFKVGHITCKYHDLQVTWPTSHTTHMTYKSHDLQVTWPASHMTNKSHDQQVTWLYHTSLSPCLIQRRSGHWKSSLMGYSTLPTWVNSLVVRTTDWRKRSPHHHCQNQRTVMHFTTYDHVRWHDCHMTVTWHHFSRAVNIHYPSLVPRLLVGREEKSLVSTVRTCTYLSPAEHVSRQ